MNSKRTQAIGVFDSGLGGLTVMQQIARVLPNEKIIYLGDTARLPYGEKSPETIIRYTIENAIFLMEQNIKVFVIACNTATAFALSKIQNIFNIPVIGVVTPGAEQALKVTKNHHIGVIGTKGTIRSKAYERKIQELNPQAKVVSIACPLFVPLVEEGFHHHQVAQMLIEEYLAPLKAHPIDTLLLGCTHYPILQEQIQDFLGPEIAIVDSASTCAERVKQTLQECQLETPLNCPQPGQFFVTDNPEKFQLLGQKFFQDGMEKVSIAFPFKVHESVS
ncbi:Glutamate racemase [Chlamydiales bacterium STE3]|nr:Glutamate racemase [Chlamydiales bacterium STE3]